MLPLSCTCSQFCDEGTFPHTGVTCDRKYSGIRLVEAHCFHKLKKSFLSFFTTNEMLRFGRSIIIPSKTKLYLGDTMSLLYRTRL